MSNRFDRAEKEKKVTPGGGRKSEVEDTIIPSPVAEPAKTENPLQGKIDPPKEERGKTCGFFLSVEAQQNIEKLAKQNKCSKSKALDVLLRSLYE